MTQTNFNGEKLGELSRNNDTNGNSLYSNNNAKSYPLALISVAQLCCSNSCGK